MSRKNGNNGGVTGTTRTTRTNVVKEKEKKQKPPRLSQEEKEMKHGKAKYLNYKIDLKFKTENQKKLYNAIKDPNIQILFVHGEAGVGKSIITMAACLELIQQKYKKITLIAPIVQNDEQIGMLPGDVSQKIFPHLECHIETAIKVIDFATGHGGKEIVENLLSEGIIEGRPVSFLRGWTFDNQIVIFEEIQNAKISALKTVCTRLGENSKMIFLGDCSQIDVKELKNNGLSALEFALNKFGDGEIPEIQTVKFERSDIVRNPLITKILDKWDK